MELERPTFTIQWSLFTEADSPHHAVRIALVELQKMLDKPSTGANRFTVFSEEDGEEVVNYINADEVNPDDEVDVWAAFQSKPR